MAAIFALAASLLWGTSDFAGGVAARRGSSLSVLLVETPVGLAVVLVGALSTGGNPSMGALGWGALSGLAAGVGVLAFYRGLETGTMSVVAPVSAMTAAAVPVVAGLGIGERPGMTPLLGVGLCLVAITLISTGGATGGETEASSHRGPGVVALAVLAGTMFGLYFVLLKPVAAGAGLWPLVASRLAAWIMVAAAALSVGGHRPIATGEAPWAARVGNPLRWTAVGGTARLGPWLVVVAGCLDGGAQIFYLSSLHHGLLISVAVLASMYPAVTVLLARILLAERLRRVQQLGLAIALAGVVLTALP